RVERSQSAVCHEQIGTDPPLVQLASDRRQGTSKIACERLCADLRQERFDLIDEAGLGGVLVQAPEDHEQAATDREQAGQGDEDEPEDDPTDEAARHALGY